MGLQMHGRAECEDPGVHVGTGYCQVQIRQYSIERLYLTTGMLPLYNTEVTVNVLKQLLVGSDNGACFNHQARSCIM
jgi:hypothetical protein